MIENKSLGSKIFDILNVVLLIAVTLICIVPVWYVLCVSLSSREAVNAGQVALWPVGFNLLSYRRVHTNSMGEIIQISKRQKETGGHSYETWVCYSDP